MSKSFGLFTLFAVAVITCLPWTAAAQTAKEEKADKVKITTVDGVDLYGKFYPCTDSKIKNPPMVLMLHSIGENSSKKAWVSLAETLQKKSAVLTFDFRGHGLSTDVDPATFWSVPFNRNMKGGAAAAQNMKQSIDHKEFEKSYTPALINDIAACKCYLDRKNDTGTCNTSSFIIIGADSAAALGAVWINSEWHRHRLIQHPVTLLFAPQQQTEGRDYIAGVWLSMNPQITATRSISPYSTLDIAMVKNATPMVFMYADQDKKGKAIAESATKFAKGKDKAKYPFTAAVEVKAGNLTGMGLLQKSLNVEGAISDYLFGNPDRKIDGVVDSKGREWNPDREFKKTQYIWRQPGTVPGAPGPFAKSLNDTNLLFSTYERYMR